MALFYFLAAPALVLALLLAIILAPKRVRAALIVSGSGVTLRASLYGIRLVRSYSCERLLNILADGLGKKSKERKWKLRFHQVRESVRLEELAARGRLGFAADAAASAMFCGALGCALEAAFAALSDGARFSARIMPDFTRKVFWIYLEGMLKIHTGKIIIALMGQRLKEEYKKWRILSKTLWKRPWQSSGRWST